MSTRADDGPPPLTEPKAKRKSGSWLLLALLLPMIGGMVGLMAGAVWAYASPKKYESRAVVQVTPPMVDLAGGVGAAGPQQSPQFMATEFAVISSQATLERAAKRLDLAARWNLSGDEILEVLSEILRTEQIRGTDLIEIRVRHTNPLDARDIAEAIAKSYVDRRTEREMERAQVALNTLDAELRAQEDLVEEKRKVLDTIVQAIGIPYVEGSGTKPIAELPDRVRIELEAEQAQLSDWIEKLTKLEGDDLFQFAAGLNLPENGVVPLFQNYRAEVRVLEQLIDGGLGEFHPKVVAQSARVDIMEEDLRRSALALREILETQAELLEKRLEKLRQVVSNRRDDAGGRALESQDYIESKRAYEDARGMLQQQKLMHSSTRIALKIPRQPVTIHENPRAGKAPVSPNVPLTLGAGAVGGGVLGFVVAILIGLVGLLRGIRN